MGWGSGTLYNNIFLCQFQEMDNSIITTFRNLVFSKHRLWKISKRFAILGVRLIKPQRFPNKNIEEKFSKIPQPAYCNVKSDLSVSRFVKSNLWSVDLNALYSVSQKTLDNYNKFDYDSITKAFYPTKNSAMECINQSNIWSHSYFNPKNLKTSDWTRQADALFADMMTNTQGVYKAKRLFKDTPQYAKAKKQFASTLNKHKKHFGEEYADCEDLIDSLVAEGKLFYIDYPTMRDMEDSKQIRSQIKLPKYQVDLVDSQKKTYRGYIEIPFALFAELPNYVEGQEKSFVCVGTTFNDSDAVYHPFYEPSNLADRDKWEMAKLHIANCDNNDFIIREHLGLLHFASAIYTTAFCNVAKKKPEWKWVIQEFVNTFSKSFLQINFLANLTLIDNEDPVAEKTTHLRASQSLYIINKNNRQFKIAEFSPHIMGDEKTTYQSDSVKLSKKYYDKLALYVDYLFRLHEDAFKGKKALQFYEVLFNELGSGKFDGVSRDIKDPDQAREEIKKIMKNLIYLWVVHHGETFSIISVGNAYYFVPTFLRKPISDIDNIKAELTDKQKQEWLAPLNVWNNSMALSKQVTYRSDRDTILSEFNRLPVDEDLWRSMSGNVDLEDHWNDISLEAYKVNYHRTVDQKLFNLHWLMPQEMPNALNI